jgi:cold shock CspA family protein
MHYRTVAWFDAQRGIGVITIEDSGFEVPVRSAQIDGGGRQSRTQHSRVAFKLLDAVHEPLASTPSEPTPSLIHRPARRTPARDSPDHP